MGTGKTEARRHRVLGTWGLGAWEQEKQKPGDIGAWERKHEKMKRGEMGVSS